MADAADAPYFSHDQMTWRFARKAEGQGQACDLCDSFLLLPQVEPRDILLTRNRKNRRRKGKMEAP
jgi:hypothetical protein